MLVKTDGTGEAELLNSGETCSPVEVPSLNVLPFAVPYNTVVSGPTATLLVAGSFHPCKGLPAYIGIDPSLSVCRL